MRPGVHEPPGLSFMSWKDMADRVLTKTIQAFKTTATYTPADGSGEVEIDGVFDTPFQSINPSTGAAVISTQPTFGIRLDDLESDPTAGDEITIESQDYLVISFEEDGQGGARLVLQKEG
jgi:hypothetical protein